MDVIRTEGHVFEGPFRLTGAVNGWCSASGTSLRGVMKLLDASMLAKLMGHDELHDSNWPFMKLLSSIPCISLVVSIAWSNVVVSRPDIVTPCLRYLYHASDRLQYA